MVAYETEEQQVEAIKEFWKENGNAIILGAVIGIGGIFGWNYYKDHKQAQSEKASEEYSATMKSVVAEGENTAFVEKAESLKGDYSETSYASLAALKLAQQYVEQNKFDQAEEQLRWVVDQSNETFDQVARLRLARVQLQQQKLDDALNTVDAIKDDAYKASALLIKGEVLLAKQDVDAAKQAFIEAKEASKGIVAPMLRLRLTEFGLEK